MGVPKSRDREPRQPPPAAEPKPDPNVEAPAFVWVNKGYDPRKPNPGRVGEPREPHKTKEA
jgi:hypothetical protein